MPVVQIQYIGRFFCPKWVQVFNILLRYTWACGHEKSGIYTHPKIIDQPTLSPELQPTNYAILSHLEYICILDKVDLVWQHFRNVLKTFSNEIISYPWRCVCMNMRATCILGHMCSYIEKWEVNSVGDRRVSPVAGTDICGSVVFINGGSDTQWVAPSLALVRSLSSLISLSLVSRHYAALRPPAVIYNNIRRPRV